MQSVLSRIWTRVAMSISYDDNHYTSGTTMYLLHKQHYQINLLIPPTSEFFHKDGFGKNNPWRLICHETMKPTQNQHQLPSIYYILIIKRIKFIHSIGIKKNNQNKRLLNSSLLTGQDPYIAFLSCFNPVAIHSLFIQLNLTKYYNCFIFFLVAFFLKLFVFLHFTFDFFYSYPLHGLYSMINYKFLEGVSFLHFLW